MRTFNVADVNGIVPRNVGVDGQTNRQILFAAISVMPE